MTSKCLTLLVGFCLAGLFAQDAAAYYHAPLGRFLTRDPAGQMTGAPRLAMDTTMVPNQGRFMARDSYDDAGGGFDPMAQYNDGMNFYQYARSMPNVFTDPTGLAVWIENTDQMAGFHQVICVHTRDANCNITGTKKP